MPAAVPDSTGRTASSSGPAAGPAFDRSHALSRLAREHFDVLVIGGGITGAGVALDAASRGLRTALVEKDDFASGTSSKSSKLVHGGLRYLQQREFRLVYENLAERQRLLDNAPHLVSPLPFLIPLFGKDGVINRSVATTYLTALWLYDLTGGMRIGQRHQRVTRAQALEHLPTLRTDRLVAGFLYWDARTDDARLTLEVLRTAVLDHGAVAANHVAVTAMLTNDGRAEHGSTAGPEEPAGPGNTGSPGSTVSPGSTSNPGSTSSPGSTITGARVSPDGGQAFDISATVVVNATGVWADEVRGLDEGPQPPSIRPAKGIHITIPADRLPCDIAAVIPVRQDHRSIFVVSWGEQVYLGTTDTEWDGPLDDPACLPEDVDYILDAANAVVTSPITRDDILGIWAGLRPLLLPPKGKGKLKERTADLSRRHTVQTSPAGVVTVTGGKLTTYRKMAQDTVDAVVARLGRRSLPSVTKNLKLHGAGHRDHAPAATIPDDTVRDADAASRAAAHLAGRFGTDTPQVLALSEGHPELLEPLVPGLPYLAVEAVYAVRFEMARSLSDVLDRRTRAVLHDAAATADAAHRVAALIAPDLGWTDERADAEAEAYAATVRGVLVRAGLGADVVSAAVSSAQPSSAESDRSPEGGPTSREERT
ncbi:MAG TPA: glycerol-3-phosphate dehydrogenase/oxidase [Acidimicrobiales bacterium]|nr:glycerol-3-phosphate dehydrogenase/oxidase [Acidimicrobiales bacterium]